jgi:hypothetical protein
LTNVIGGGNIMWLGWSVDYCGYWVGLTKVFLINVVGSVGGLIWLVGVVGLMDWLICLV